MEKSPYITLAWIYVYSRLDSVLCPTHCFWFKTVFWGMYSCHDTLDKMLESGGIVKSKMIPLCSLWQHGLNSFIRNTCFLWQLVLIIDDKSQFLSSSQLQEGWQTLLFLHAAGWYIKMSPLCVEKLQKCSQDLMCHKSKSRLFPDEVIEQSFLDGSCTLWHKSNNTRSNES